MRFLKTPKSIPRFKVVIFSHVNDGGFWLIKEYFNMTVAQTFKTWTVLETLISVVAFGLTLGLITQATNE